MQETHIVAAPVMNGIFTETALGTKMPIPDNLASVSERDIEDEQKPTHSITSDDGQLAQMSATEDESLPPPTSNGPPDIVGALADTASRFTGEAAEAEPVSHGTEGQGTPQIVQSSEDSSTQTGGRLAESESIEKPLLSADLTVTFIRPGRGSAASQSSSMQQSPFGGVPAKDSEGWWDSDRRSQPNQMSSSAEHDSSRVMSDEEVEEAEAVDSFPALGFPRSLASVGVGSLGSGDFSDDMRKMGAAGSDWSDWDAHLPASPSTSNPIDSMASSLNRTLSTQTSNKFEVAEGEDEELKQTMWVVEHLQEELIAADNARMAADEQVQRRSHIVQALQLQVQDRVSILADLKEQIEEKHKQLEQQLLQQLEIQELLRQREEEIRETVAETAVINQTIQEKDEEMAELKVQAAEQKLACQSQAAASSRGRDSKEKAGTGAGGSPHSNMSSPWATDVSESEDEEEGPAAAARTVTPLSRVTPLAKGPTSTTAASAPAAPAEAIGFGSTWLRGVLGATKKLETPPMLAGTAAEAVDGGSNKAVT